MSEMITVRDADMIAAEINEVKRQVQEVVIYASIKIGGKLTEAKSLVNHGEWGKWLEENVEYSQSTANYLMQLYQEYGSNQESLFDTWTNSQTFAKLSYSQHIALLALPFGERQEFAEQNHVEDMSTRELKEAIRERDAAQNALGDAEEKLSDAYGAIKEIKREREKELQDAEREMNLVREDLAKEKSKVAAAETKEKEMLAHLNKLQKDLQEAQAAEQAAVEDLKKATENPEVPESVMEQLRKEAAAEAAKEARAALQKKLETAEKKAGEAEQARVAAEAAAHEAEQKLAEAQKGSKLADPDVAKFLAFCEQLQDGFNRILGLYLKNKGTDDAKAQSMKNATLALLEKCRKEMEG